MMTTLPAPNIFKILVTSPSKTALTCAFWEVLISIPLLFVNTLSMVGWAFLPKPSVILPYSTGQGNFPLYASNVLLNETASFVFSV
jgi:hypothetical protein